MKKGLKIVTSFVLSLLVVFAIVPNLNLKAEAKSASVGIGTTWYVGDTVNAGEAWFDFDNTWPGHCFDQFTDGTVIPSFRYDEWSGCWYFKSGSKYCNWYLCDYGTPDVEPTGITIVSGSGTESDPFKFKCIYDKKTNSASTSTDWLNPLRTQLAIAADPEIGKNVKNTVEYTGDFALPAETMQFLKDHPEVTLKYTFDYKGETHTVVIPGKSVVIEEGVLWYGFENLLGRYGK